jgi:hypothetical protein
MNAKKMNGCSPLRPSVDEVRSYFKQNGLVAKAADGFYQYYNSRKWKTDRGCPIRSWKTAAWNWILLHQQAKATTIEVKLRLQFPPQP